MYSFYLQLKDHCVPNIQQGKIADELKMYYRDIIFVVGVHLLP